MKKKALITGAAGFIGYHVAIRLLKKNFKLILLDNFTRGKKDKYFNRLIKNKNVTFKNIDLTKPISIKEKNINYVFHFAAHLGVKNVISNPNRTFNDNIKMLVNLLDTLKKFNSKTKFIFFSTSEVYSPLIQSNKAIFPLKEDVDLVIKNQATPRDSYYLSKIIGERIVQLSGLKFVCFRPHNIYGPRMGYSHVIPELIKKINSGNKNSIKVYSPTHKRAFCYIDDAIDQIISVSFSKVANKIFNIGNSNQEIKMFELAKLIKKICNSKVGLKKTFDTPGSPKRRIPSLVKIKKYINKKKYISLNEGIKQYLFFNSK